MPEHEPDSSRLPKKKFAQRFFRNELRISLANSELITNGSVLPSARSRPVCPPSFGVSAKWGNRPCLPNASRDRRVSIYSTHAASFSICENRGSSPNRSWRCRKNSVPLSWRELPEFDLLRALDRGLLPSHYDSSAHRRALDGYATDYLKEEIFDEGLTRNAAAFSRFFNALSFSHGEILNFSSLARDCGVNSKTVREYFQILEDTLLGHMVEPFARRRSHAIIS